MMIALLRTWLAMRCQLIGSTCLRVQTRRHVRIAMRIIRRSSSGKCVTDGIREVPGCATNKQPDAKGCQSPSLLATWYIHWERLAAASDAMHRDVGGEIPGRNNTTVTGKVSSQFSRRARVSQNYYAHYNISPVLMNDTLDTTRRAKVLRADVGMSSIEITIRICSYSSDFYNCNEVFKRM